MWSGLSLSNSKHFPRTFLLTKTSPHSLKMTSAPAGTFGQTHPDMSSKPWPRWWRWPDQRLSTSTDTEVVQIYWQRWWRCTGSAGRAGIRQAPGRPKVSNTFPSWRRTQFLAVTEQNVALIYFNANPRQICLIERCDSLTSIVPGEERQEQWGQDNLFTSPPHYSRLMTPRLSTAFDMLRLMDY